MDVYTTAGVPRHARARYWNEIYATRFALVRFDPVDREGFEAELRVGTAGPLGIARIHSQPTDIERTPAHIGRSSGRLFSFVLQLRGSGAFTHYGHETTLDAGDFTLCDNALPHRLRFRGPAELIVLRVAPEALQAYFPFPERICGLKLPARHGFTDTAAAMTRNLWDEVERGLSAKFSALAGRNLMDLMATSYAVAFDPWIAEAPSPCTRRLEAKRFIDGHLKDADLTPEKVAGALRVSPRYLRKLFSAERETVSAYILRRRLEECARLIASPLWRGRTITHIAFGCGFNSAAHFSRAFHGHYGIAPREYREAHLPKQPALG